MNRILLLAVVTALTVARTAPADAAVTLACGPDPVANVADILCAPPSGPCDDTTVVVGKNLTLSSGPCEFDLQGRALRIDRTLQIRIDSGDDFNLLDIVGAGDVTIGKHGRVKSRGDFVRPNGVTTYGGLVRITSTGAVRVAGLIDMSGDPGGGIEIDADGAIVFERSARVRADGIDGFVDMGMRVTDGGYFVAWAGTSIAFRGRAQLRGGTAGSGGSFDLEAHRDVDLAGAIDVSGGGYAGGDIGILGGDDVRISRSKIDLRSRAGGGDGGFIDIEAGTPFDPSPLPGIVVGGSLTIDRTIVNASGSANNVGAAGQGGDVSGYAYGRLNVSRLTVHADSAQSPENTDGVGGYIDFGTVIFNDDGGPVEQPSDLDASIDAFISARGAGNDGGGGEVYFSSAGNLDLAATIDAGARGYGALLAAGASGDLTVRAPIDTAIDGTNGEGGRITLAAGLDRAGTLTIASDIHGGGGRRNPLGPTLDLRGCPVVVAAGVTIDAAGGSTAAGEPGTATLAFVSGRPLQLGKGSRYFARPNGTITAYHPAMQNPVIGSGVLFDPALLDVVAPASLFPMCPP